VTGVGLLENYLCKTEVYALTQVIMILFSSKNC